MPEFTHDQLAAARKQAGLTQRQLAQRSGVAPSRIGALESPSVPAPVSEALTAALAAGPRGAPLALEYQVSDTSSAEANYATRSNIVPAD